MAYLKMVKYKSQALAIVLVIVIVGAIVALGIASRNSKNTIRSIDEKKSQDSTEVVNSLIDLSRSIVINEIVNNCRTEFSSNQECKITYENGILSSKGFANIPSTETFPKCNFTQNTNDVVTLSFLPVYDVEDFTLSKDDVLSFGFISSNITTSSCSNLAFNFSRVGGNQGGVTISKIYSLRNTLGEPTSYKNSEPTDIEKLSLGGAGGSGNWQNWQPSSGVWNFPGAQFVNNGYQIDELRIKAVGSDINVNMTATGCTMEPFFIKVNATSNCGGTFKSSYYYRPLKNKALPIFDYVLYNQNGTLEFAD
jgi:hypothetical protein